MSDQRIVVIGGSAGAVEGMITIARLLPPDFNASICVVVHIPPEAPSALGILLNRAGPLPAEAGRDGARIEPGHIYVASPNRHLLVRENRVRCGDGPRENRHRPSIDALFRTAAHEFGPRVIGVLLSGNLDDGVAGLVEIKQHGGTVIVLDPEDALYDGMPRNAIRVLPDIDHIVALEAIPALLVKLQDQPSPSMPEAASHRDVAERGPDRASAAQPVPGVPSPYSCPDCVGVLWEVHENGEQIHYRCRTGHAYSPESLLVGASQSVEDAMWVALRALAESAAQARDLEERMRARGHDISARRFAERASDFEDRAHIIRKALHGLNEPLHPPSFEISAD